MIFVQGLMDGIDFMEKITRSEFQEMSKELLREIVSPIKSFLFEYDLKIEDIDGV